MIYTIGKVKRLLFLLLFLCFGVILSAQVSYRTDTLTNAVNDTAIIILPGEAATITIQIDTVSGAATADIIIEGTAAGYVWFPLYVDPGTTGNPTLSPVTIDSEVAVFVPGAGSSGTSQLKRPFKLMRIITVQTGVGAHTYRYNVITN